jgi:glutamate racemase
MIGLIDWGIGGLSVYRELKKFHPDVPCIYFSDSGAIPYGKMSKSELIARLHLISDFFRKNKVRQIIIACNAASTVIENIKTKNPDLIYFGMLDSGAFLIKKSKLQSYLILGGFRTVRSKYFQNYFQNSNISIQVKAAQPWSALIEAGDLDSYAFHESIVKVLSNLKFKPDGILLACTHYPAISPQIQKLLPRSKILDPSQAVVKKILKNRNWKNIPDQFFTTGSVEKTKSSAKKAFNIKLKKIIKLSLSLRTDHRYKK